MKIKLSIRSSFGFTIIEILVAVGILSIVGLAISSVVVELHRQNKILSNKLESIELEQSLNRLFFDSSSCGDVCSKELHYPPILMPFTVSMN